MSDQRERYFSNGTEGRMWEAAWCQRCLHDNQFQRGHGTGCPIMAKALAVDDHRDISEWLYYPEHVTDPVRRVVCIEFKPYGWRNPKPDPKPVPPGQGLLAFGDPVLVEIGATR